MKIIGNTCYSRLLWIMCSGEKFQQAVSRLTFKAPQFCSEGMAGYISTDYEIEIADLFTFSNLWNSWYSLTDKRKLELYGLAKGLGDCK